MKALNRITRHLTVALGMGFAAAGMAHAGGTVGTTFPEGFVEVPDAALGVPVIGFGGAGRAARTPVIFLHGNNGTPYPTGCERNSANILAMAQYFADYGYSTSELWGLGYQGTQCDLNDQPANASSFAHTVAANVVDLRKFVKAVMASTGAKKVDFVAHGMGVTLVREFARQDSGSSYVRRVVAIEGVNQGMEVCAAVAGNSWALGMMGGFTPDSPVCQELGSPNTAFLRQLNKTTKAVKASAMLVIRNGDSSFLFRPGWDGLVQGAPAAIDSFGMPFDFAESARIPGAPEIVLTGQNAYDYLQGTAHVGIANSPITMQAAFDFLAR